MATNKKEIIRLLEEIATYMELKGENSFKISAFRKSQGRQLNWIAEVYLKLMIL